MPDSHRTIDRAAEIAFDPAATGLGAAEVQAALDAIHALVVLRLTQTLGDARYPLRSANLSDLASAATARENLDVAAAYRFGAAGVITTGQKTPAHRVRAAGTAFALDLTLSAGTATAAIEASTDGGSTWPTTVGTVAVASGKANTATISTALTAGTLLRVNYTAVGSASDPVVSLHVR